MPGKIKSILVDDEKNSREVLAALIQRFCPEVELCGMAIDVESAYELITTVKPDLIFLDIQMPRSNGFNLLKKFDPVPFEVIFVTSYDKYAINAIKFSALDYILKPVEIGDLQSAVKKGVANVLAKKNNQPLIINLLHNIQPDTAEKKVAVHSNGNVKILEVKDIVYIESDSRYSKLTLNSGEIFTTAKTLREFEEYLEPAAFFVRISKQLMLNVSYIMQYTKGDPFSIQLKNGKVFEVARRKKAEVLEKLKGFM
ncbi:MAG: response regulator transcription factor [Bacteroidetes bacterium]|nr:response regulator transcription factor [Bacteroidota bacterium]